MFPSSSATSRDKHSTIIPVWRHAIYTHQMSRNRLYRGRLIPSSILIVPWYQQIRICWKKFHDGCWFMLMVCSSITTRLLLKLKLKCRFVTADPATDHKLKWDMFKLSELECFDSMMFRMFKQEMEALITRHESYRWDIWTYLIQSYKS